jgi:small subunit ribosomal protein S4
MRSILRNYRAQARKLIAARTEQAKKEKKQLLDSLFRLGLLEKGAELDDVLALTIRDVMERRLQTLVFRKKLSNTVGQARQFITHNHICVGEKVITSPSYIVSRDEEFHIKVNPNSPLLGKIKGVKVGS